MSVFLAWCAANQTLIATVLFAISETMGASSKIKSNGILSLVLIQAQKVLKDRGAKDLTP